MKEIIIKKTVQKKTNNFYIVGLITGHAEVSYHKYKMLRAEGLKCELSGLEGITTKYILCDCDALVNKRKLTLGMDFIEEIYFRAGSIRGELQFRKRIFRQQDRQLIESLVEV